MTPKDRNMLLGLLVVVALAGSWFLLISPQRKAAAAARSQVTQAQQQLASAQQDVKAGQAAEAAFRRDRVAIVKLGRVVPESDDIPSLLVQLEVLARRHKVKFNSYELAQGSVGGKSAPGGANSAAGAGGTGTVTTVGADGKPTTSADATAPLYPPGSSEIPGGLGRTTITLKLAGTYFNLERYLRAVQHFAIVSAEKTQAKGRLMMVDSFDYQLKESVTEVEFSKADAESETQVEVKKNSAKKLTAELSASVYFAPPVETPAGGGAGVSGTTPAAPAAGGASATGTATIGGVK